MYIVFVTETFYLLVWKPKLTVRFRVIGKAITHTRKFYVYNCISHKCNSNARLREAPT